MAAFLAAAVVLSHWFLDLLVHVPDLTIAGNPPKLGFGLWNYPAIEMTLELTIIIGALWLYARFAKPKKLPLLTLAGVMVVLQMINWFGPVEPNVTAGTSVLAFAAFGLITLVSYWTARSASRAQH